MATKSKPTLQQRPMACVTIDSRQFLLPFADAQRLVGIMAGAVECERRYDGNISFDYLVDATPTPPAIEMAVVHPQQVKVKPREHVPGHLQIGQEPLKLR